MSDLISRQDAITKFNKYCTSESIDKNGIKRGEIHTAMTYEGIIKIIEALPSVEPGQKKGEWIPVSEALPENRNVVLVTVYWHETYQVMMASYYGDGLWWCVPYNNCGKHMQKLNPIAWMPLPEGYRGE